MTTAGVNSNNLCPYSKEKKKVRNRAKEMSNAATIRTWLSQLRDVNSPAFVSGIRLPRLKAKKRKQSTFSGLSIEDFECDLDPETGKPSDEDAFITFESGEVFRGGFSDGDFNGRGVLLSMDGRELSGTFKDGCLVGWATVRWPNGAFREEYHVRGWPTGYYREVSEQGLVAVRMGDSAEWREMQGGGVFFFSEATCHEQQKGEKVTEVAFLRVPRIRHH